MKKLWYYTSVKEVEKIILDGVINLPSEGNLNDDVPCIWLSSNPDWDTPPNTISHNKRGLNGITVEIDILARVEILPDATFKDWTTYKKIAHIAESESVKIEQLAFEGGANPQDWHYSSKKISQNRWVDIEYLEGNKWQQFPP